MGVCTMIALWLLVALVAAGCASHEYADKLVVESGCEMTTDWCIGCRVVCVEGYDAEGGEQDREVGEPGAVIKYNKGK